MHSDERRLEFRMKKIMIVAGLLALTAPAFASASGGGVVIGAPFGVRVEAENRIKTVKECSESSTTGAGGATIQERREERR